MAPATTETASTVAAGAVELYRLDVRPSRPSRAALALFHGYGEHSRRYIPLMRRCAEAGIACSAIDWPGHGRSGGRRGNLQSWEQLAACISTLLDDPASYQVPTFAFAHSFGGLVLARAAQVGLLQRVRGLILSNPYLRNSVPVPPHKHLLACIARWIAPNLLVPSGLPVEWLTSDPEMIEDARRDELLLRSATPRWYFLTRQIQRQILSEPVSLPLLMLLGDADCVADPEAGALYFNESTSADKTLARYPDLKHELVRETARTEVMDRIVNWISARCV